MKKYTLILLLLLISCVSCFAQSPDSKERFYYHKGQKVYLSVNKKSFIVFYEEDSSFNSVLQKKYKSVNKKGQQKNKSGMLIEGAVVIIDDVADYSREMEYLKNQKEVIAVEIVIGDSVTVPVSNHFSVKLKNISDTILLRNTAKETKTNILGPIPYCKNWYELVADKNSVSDCLGVSNIFVESNKFEKVDPGFISDIKLNCLTDTDFDLQWAINNDYVNINACEAWDISTGDNNVNIAIIDEGIKMTHDEFVNTNFTESYDVMRDSPVTVYQSGNHGTRVCGVISSSHNLDKIAGIAPGLSIMNVDANPEAYNGQNRVAIGINWAVENGADIINNSWNYYSIFPFTSNIIEDAIDNAIDNGRGGLGCIVIFSSGNWQLPYSFSVKYPADYREEILCVGSVYYDEKKSSFSCYGEELDIVAPGESIWTTNTLFNNSIIAVDGTSFAAPYAAGVAGLILSKNSHLTNDQVIEIIESTAQKVGDYTYQTTVDRSNGTWHEKMGYGELDAGAALLPCPTTTIIDMTFSSTIDEIRACGEVEIQDVTVENNGGFSTVTHDGVTINGPFVAELGSQITIQ